MLVKTNVVVNLPVIPEYAKVLRVLREKKGLTQRDLAEKMGISPMGMSFYERGSRAPNVQRLDEWASYVDATVRVEILEVGQGSTKSNAGSATKH